MSFARSCLGYGCLAGLPLILAACELGPKVSQQTGYRGSGTAQVTNVNLRLPEDNIPPPPYELSADGGPPASETYENVQVLGDLSTDEFNRLMASITEWVSPAQGCNYCHNPENMASDEVYTKIVARRMLQMTRTVNAQWSNHVKATGVTCYTCHRGQPVPENTWSYGAPQDARQSIVGNKHGQNAPDPNVGFASLPADPFAAYLKGRTGEIRVAASRAFPSSDWQPGIKDAEGTYGLMMHLSSALGVNCTYCHNTQSFRSWGNSTQQRTTAFHGVRMVRTINEDFITSLQTVFPANRLGPQGDPYKVNCSTCHQGKPKPLGGYNMLKVHPELGRLQTAALVAPPADATVIDPPEVDAAVRAETGGE